MSSLTAIFDKSNVAERKKNTRELNELLCYQRNPHVDIARAKELIRNGIDLSVMHEHSAWGDIIGYSNAIVLCAMHRHSEILQAILDERRNGLEVNLDEPGLHRESALEWTVQEKDYETMKILADNGADFRRPFKPYDDSLLKEVSAGGKLCDPTAEKILFTAQLRRPSSPPKKGFR